MEYNLDESLGYLLNVVTGKFKHEIYRCLAPFDVTPGQWVVLTRLWEGDGKTQKQLAEETYKDEPNIARILRKLESKRYITRSPDAQDKRTSLVFLTEQGKELLPGLLSVVTQFQAHAEQYLSPKEVVIIKKLLVKLRDSWR